MHISRKAKLADPDADGGARGRDRLSELPDCLLHVILSHLKARQVVQTCVLSRRWQKLWLASLCLDVDINEFLPHAAPHPTRLPHYPAVNYAALDPYPPYQPVAAAPYAQQIVQEEELYVFEDFVDCLLVHRSAGGTPPLDTLRLHIQPGSPTVPRPTLFASSNETKHSSWVRHGLRCSPAALDVSGFVKFPPLSSSSTRRLTKLRLHRVILHPYFEEHLKSGLPVLEDLEISGTDLSGLTTISSSTLKHLAVDTSSAMTVYTGGMFAFTIVAPRLASLHLAVQFINLRLFGVVVHEAPRLVRASIRLVDKPELRRRHGGFYVQDDRALVTSLCKLLDSLSHVLVLELHDFRDMTVVQQHPPGPPWMQPHNFLQPHIPFIPLHIPPAPGPGVGPQNYHQVYGYDTWNLHQPVMPPLGRPMLQAILEVEEEHGGLLVFDGLSTLVLDECDTGHQAQTLWRFLHNAPVLEKLTLKNCQFQIFPKISEMEQRQTVLETATVSSDLKSVDIIYGNNHQGGGQYKVQINELSSSMIKWRLPATTMIRVTKLPNH